MIIIISSVSCPPRQYPGEGGRCGLLGCRTSVDVELGCTRLYEGGGEGNNSRARARAIELERKKRKK